jgi:hypothetical protein
VVGHSEHDEIVDWHIAKEEGNWKVSKQKMKLTQYLVNKFDEISNGPEIEVLHRGDRPTTWLFKRARPIASLTDLTSRTSSIFEELLHRTERDGHFNLCAVCSTGEWLFHRKGWAFSIGRRILDLVSDGRAEVFLVTLDYAFLSEEQRARAFEVEATLRQADRDDRNHKIKRLNWWSLNRRLTLVRFTGPNGGQQAKGIYFRRRSFSLIISPVYIDDHDDCLVLTSIFNYYLRKP